MAKQQFVSVQFTAGESAVQRTGITYKKLPLKDDALRFLHIERKGNTELLFDATRFVDDLPDSLTITFDRTGDLPTFVVAGRSYTIAKYTVLNTELDKPFYYLDELPDGTWRLCHTTGYIPWDHEHVDTVVITKVPVHI
ncbi:hypothetical protein D3C85_101430 [compost metagenome]